jgi:hypothetical protein
MFCAKSIAVKLSIAGAPQHFLLYDEEKVHRSLTILPGSTLIAPDIRTPPLLDYTARRSRFTVGILLVHGSALVEVAAAALITLLTAQPLGRLTLHSCGVIRFDAYCVGLHCPQQCCGSGSTCFWASWIRIRMLLSLSKYSMKNLDFYCFVTFFLFLSLKNDVKILSKINVPENFLKN